MFSLDPILGYHIKPNIIISRQPFIVKLSIAMIIIMFVGESIVGSFSVAIFQSKKSRDDGCVLLASNEWLNTCVAVERMVNVIKGVNFDKTKSKTIAKKMILMIIIFTVLTHLHDPLHRELIDDLDGDQQRIWCFARYTPSISAYNSFITLFHFLTPFPMNIISILLLMIVAARNRSKIEKKGNFQQHFRLQFLQHKHLLITSILLTFLGLLRLIISFISGCMRSARLPWLYLFGYFLSFIPSMSIFFIFVLLSTTYRKEFYKIIEETIRRCYL